METRTTRPQQGCQLQCCQPLFWYGISTGIFQNSDPAPAPDCTTQLLGRTFFRNTWACLKTHWYTVGQKEQFRIIIARALAKKWERMPAFDSENEGGTVPRNRASCLEAEIVVPYLPWVDWSRSPSSSFACSQSWRQPPSLPSSLHTGHPAGHHCLELAPSVLRHWWEDHAWHLEGSLLWICKDCWGTQSHRLGPRGLL